MALLSYLRGYVTLELKGASLERVINGLSQRNVPFWNFHTIDDFTWQLQLFSCDVKPALTLAQKTQNEGIVLASFGLKTDLARYRHRKVFFVSMILIPILVAFLSNFIFFYQVEGNISVPAPKILEELEKLGYGFGASTHGIVPQDLKNEMLQTIPELEWFTLTANGNIATVTVRERNPEPVVIDRKTVSNLVAKEDCLITEMSVLSGAAACLVGDFRAKGELLVSGYADLEFCYQATPARAEIFGRTWRIQKGVLPAEMVQIGQNSEENTRYSLVVGKKRINFFKNSGIWGAGCVKIIESIPLTLWGGYTLPVTLIKETLVTGDTSTISLSPLVVDEQLVHATLENTKAQLVAGTVEDMTYNTTQTGAIYRLDGIYQCHEMVGITAPALQFEDGNLDGRTSH